MFNNTALPHASPRPDRNDETFNGHAHERHPELRTEILVVCVPCRVCKCELGWAGVCSTMLFCHTHHTPGDNAETSDTQAHELRPELRKEIVCGSCRLCECEVVFCRTHSTHSDNTETVHGHFQQNGAAARSGAPNGSSLRNAWSERARVVVARYTPLFTHTKKSTSSQVLKATNRNE